MEFSYQQMISRILELADKNGISAREVSTYAGMGLSAMNDWKNGRGKPSIEAIVNLSNYFHVSLDYLIFGLDDNRNDLSVTTTDLYKTSEIKLLEKYRQLSQDRKNMVIAYMDGLSFGMDHPAEKQDENPLSVVNIK